MKVFHFLLAIFGILFTLFTGCKKDESPTKPLDVNVSGNWHGTATGIVGRTISWSTSLSQNNNTVTGTLAYGTPSYCSGEILLSGTINGNHLSLSFTSSSGFNFDATISGKALSGSYITTNAACFADSGSWQGTSP